MNFLEYFSETIVNSSVEGEFLRYGLLGAVTLIAFAVIIYQERRNTKKDEKIESLLTKLADNATQVNDGLKEPLSKQAELSQRIYDVLLSGKRSQ